MHEKKPSSYTSRTALEHSLSVLGLVALVGFGLWLAFYSARFVPATVSSLSSVAVGLSSMLVPSTASLTVIPTVPLASVAFDDESATTSDDSPIPPIAEVSAPPVPAKSTTPATPTRGSETSTTYPMGTGAVPTNSGTSAFFGLSDLTATILATGYLTSTSTDSFIASSTVPRGARAAVMFSIQNIGTNVADSNWRFSAALPAQSGYVFYSPAQQVLNPGDRIDYILGFDQATPGVNHSISIIANSDHALHESTESNNGSTASVTIISP